MSHPVTELTAAPSARAVLRDFLRFLKQPRVLHRQPLRSTGQWRRWAWLTGLLIAGLIGVLLPLLALWQRVFALPAPEAFGAMSPQMLVPVVVLVAPVLEELLFRGWQSGSAAALWLLGCALVCVGALVIAAQSPWLAIGAILGAGIAALLGWRRLRHRPAPLAWFARSFPVIFYLVAAGFALLHLMNYPRFSLLAVPLVLPQLWAALVLGYIRQRIGLVPGIAAHMLANAASLGLALAVS
jgi:membrane protease YdiL (CAAX protease family)